MTTFDEQTEKEIAIFSLTEKYIKTLKWSKDSDDYIKTLVIGNIRGFFQWLYRNGYLNVGHVVDSVMIEDKAKD
jgi:hypothetical protein